MLNLSFALRTDWDCIPNTISREILRLRRAGKKILDLTESNPTACGLGPGPAVLKALQHAKNTRYEPDPRGLRKAREAIAGYYRRHGVHVSPENIVLASSTSEAYSWILRLLADPGDTVLFPAPSYPLWDHLARLNDVRMHRYALRYDGAWHVDAAIWEKPWPEKTRAVFAVHPNNPTGSYLSREECHRMLERCREQSCALISDEVFLDYPANAKAPRPPTLAAAQNKALVFVLGGLSKLLGLPQMKLAWICVSGPAKLRQEALKRLEIIADTYLSVNTPAQNALPIWMKHQQAITGRIARRVCRNRAALKRMDWRALGCEALAAQGGWYGILRVPAVRSEEEWVLHLLKKQNVLVQPGFFFDFDNEAYLILSLLPQKAVFQEGMRRLRKGLGA